MARRTCPSCVSIFALGGLRSPALWSKAHRWFSKVICCGSSQETTFISATSTKTGRRLGSWQASYTDASCGSKCRSMVRREMPQIVPFPRRLRPSSGACLPRRKPRTEPLAPRMVCCEASRHPQSLSKLLCRRQSLRRRILLRRRRRCAAWLRTAKHFTQTPWCAASSKNSMDGSLKYEKFANGRPTHRHRLKRQPCLARCRAMIPRRQHCGAPHRSNTRA
jgi:hypothetical protein